MGICSHGVTYFFTARLYLLYCCSFVSTAQVIKKIMASVVECDDFIEEYFHMGLSYREIIDCLSIDHEISLSIRQLKIILSTRSLGRRRLSNFNDVVEALQVELNESGSCIGYRAMWQRLAVEHRLSASKEFVRKALRIMDPEGVDRRLRHRLRRRKYHAKGPNFFWHLDGYDKLKPYGFCIHVCIDGYSRKIMWLEVGRTNNHPGVVASYFLDCVQSYPFFKQWSDISQFQG